MTPAAAVHRFLHDLPTAAATFLALSPIVNPFGGIPLFFSLTSNYSASERQHAAFKTAVYVVAILVISVLQGTSA